MANTPRYVALIRKRVAKDVKYFERHGIETGKENSLKYTTDDAIMGAWKDPDPKFQKLTDKEKIRKIASMIAFPRNMTRHQAENLQKASVALGTPLGFADILKGNFPTETLTKLKEQKTEEYRRLYGIAHAKTMADHYIRQTYFGSE